MVRKSRKSRRGPPAGKISLRAYVKFVDDTEKLMSHSIDANPTRLRPRPHSKPPLASHPMPHHDYSAHEMTNVPAPIPDTGSPPPSADTTTLATPTILAFQSSFTPRTSASHLHEPSKSTFVPLPPLKTQNLTEIEEGAARSSSMTHPMKTALPIATTPAGSFLGGHSPQLNASRLSTTAIIALAVGGGLTLLVIITLAKLIRRPRRRKTPTPSLPILHDGTFPDRMESEGSPIFGGKERSSPTFQTRSVKENTGLWTWTQYNSGIPKPTPTVTVTRSSSQDQPVNQTTPQRGFGVADGTTQAPRLNQSQYPFVGHGHSNAISKEKSQIALQPVQNAITRAVSRLSTVSMSLYPNSPGGYLQVGADVGVAIDGVTHDEPGNAAVAKYKDRMIASRNRTSMIAASSVRDAAALRRSQSFAYGGMEPASPPTASPTGIQLNGGRARIKSTYFTPGSYPRASAAATNHYRKQDRDRAQNEVQNKTGGSDSQRGRDLTSALGLTSPIPPSPQPTLYPDDSMSVIGEVKKVALAGRSQKKPVPNATSHCDSPPSDSAALGSLMMVNFAASKSTASLVNIRPCEAARAREGQGDIGGKSSLKKRVEDRPPRVPSPPPIPSLAQMAMQHADPEGYADYHSPTYSIYGLYDGDRKSRGLSYGYS